jgi:glycine/D-amino acid oxidase-like deaminating enzyme
MGTETHDVVLIGGGIAGLSIARFLSRAGLDACVIERNDIGTESTGRCAGIIGQGHRQAPDQSLVIRAMELWKRFASESELDFEFRQRGGASISPDRNGKAAADPGACPDNAFFRLLPADPLPAIC